MHLLCVSLSSSFIFCEILSLCETAPCWSNLVVVCQEFERKCRGSVCVHVRTPCRRVANQGHTRSRQATDTMHLSKTGICTMMAPMLAVASITNVALSIATGTHRQPHVQSLQRSDVRSHRVASIPNPVRSTVYHSHPVSGATRM